MAETTKPTAFRLTEEDQLRIQSLIEMGAARDATDAVRLALRLAPIGLASALRGRVRSLAADAQRLARELEKIDPTALIDEEQLRAAMDAAITPAMRRKIERAMQRR